MSKHTPGPWVISPNRRRRLSDFQKTIEHGMSVTIMTGNGHRVAIVDGPSNIEKQAEFEANARLIAAAPDLLAACKWLAAWDGSNDDAKMISEACSMARAAIRKAEGK